VVEPYPSEKYEAMGRMTFPIYGTFPNNKCSKRSKAPTSNDI
jgi:hypothetical protein